MSVTRLHLSCLGAVAAICLSLFPARAAESVGNAVGVTPAVVGTISGTLGINLPVYRDETVSTGPTGVLELKFLDQTRLALESLSSVTLDRFVYAGNGRVDDLVLSLSKGVFRFATGVSPKKAYWIRTPLAGIGVRGTDFTAEVTPAYERFTIWEGAIEICPRQGGMSIEEERLRHCPLLKGPGNSITLFANGIKKKGGIPVRFGGRCAEANGATLCGSYGAAGGPAGSSRTLDPSAPPPARQTAPTPSPAPGPTRPTRG